MAEQYMPMLWNGDDEPHVSRRRLRKALEPYGDKKDKEPGGCWLWPLVAVFFAASALAGTVIGRWPL